MLKEEEIAWLYGGMPMNESYACKSIPNVKLRQLLDIKEALERIRRINRDSGSVGLMHAGIEAIAARALAEVREAPVHEDVSI